jgi:hypothetical protein
MTLNWVTPTEVAAQADEVVGTSLAGFQTVKSGRYARLESQDVIQVVQLKAWKGESYTIAWGVSLAFVPDRLALPLRFHRTLKSARLDLWEDSLILAERLGRSTDDGVISALEGVEAVRHQFQAAWRLVESHAQSWWLRSRNLDGVLALADALAADSDLDMIRFPPPDAVAALVCARIGRPGEALQRLSALDLEATEREALTRAIQKAAPSA